MFNWLLDLIDNIENLIKRTDRGGQAIIAILTGGFALYGGYSVYQTLTENSLSDSTGLIWTGLATVIAGYLSVISTMSCITDTSRRHDEEVAARMRAIHGAPDSSSADARRHRDKSS